MTADVTLGVALEPDKAAPVALAPFVVDTSPPRIALKQESIPKTVGPRQSRVTIIGKATDDSGVAEVAVNGRKAELGADGVFAVEILLECGETPIHVRALDIYGNVGEVPFTISRECEPIRHPVGVGVAPPTILPTRRLALIIGNAAYKVSPLRNAVNDASDMNDALKKLNFETTLLTNAKRQEMEEAIDAFSRKLRRGGAGLFYYAGHGVQIEGQNYLIPVDAPLEMAANVKSNSVAVNELLERMADAENGLNIVILDVREWRSRQQGLILIQAAQGSLIAYSTAPGNVALDGSERERNGVYTKYLLRHITKKGLSVEELFKKVRIDVQKETQNKQIPWESSSLLGDFYFAGK
jgi:hypothetical protein